jgi:pyrroline-5-carboxylate reductase
VIVGLIGAGNMAEALAQGWSAEEAGPDTLLVSDLDFERARSLAERVGGKTADSNRDLAESTDVVVLAMKPDALEAVAEDVRVTVAERELPVVSILGATPIAAVEEAFGPGTPVLRFMPNMAAEVRMGTFCYASAESLDAGTERSLLDLFGLLGELVPVPERLMDTATAISGCGPAFLALVVEALVDAGVREGLQADAATQLALNTMAGTAELLRRWEGDTALLKRKVASPGGTTAAGLAALERHALRAAFSDAVEAVVKRAKEAQAGEARRRSRASEAGAG